MWDGHENAGDDRGTEHIAPSEVRSLSAYTLPSWNIRSGKGCQSPCVASDPSSPSPLRFRSSLNAMAPRSSSGSGSAASLEHEAAAGFAPSFAPAFAHTHGRPAEAERYVPTDVPLCDTPQPGEQYEGLLGDAFKNKPLLQVRPAPRS